MKTEFEEWRDELAGCRPSFFADRGWWLVAVGVIAVGLALCFL